MSLMHQCSLSVPHPHPTHPLSSPPCIPCVLAAPLPPSHRPGELIAELSHTMCLMVQAEAATLTAFRAAAKGSSAAVVAALQAGAAELFEKAAKVVKDYSGECFPEYFLQ